MAQAADGMERVLYCLERSVSLTHSLSHTHSFALSLALSLAGWSVCSTAPRGLFLSHTLFSHSLTHSYSPSVGYVLLSEVYLFHTHNLVLPLSLSRPLALSLARSLSLSLSLSRRRVRRGEGDSESTVSPPPSRAPLSCPSFHYLCS